MTKSNSSQNDRWVIDRLKNVILDFCRVDWTGLWVAPHYLRDELGLEDDERVRELSLLAIRELADERLVEIGDINWVYSRFEQWEIPLNIALDRISKEWEALGADPGIDEICWISMAGGEAPLSSVNERKDDAY